MERRERSCDEEIKFEASRILPIDFFGIYLHWLRTSILLSSSVDFCVLFDFIQYVFFLILCHAYFLAAL